MSKYIIDINSNIAKSIVVFGMVGERGISTVFKIDELEELTADYINEHFGDLQDTAYQRGFEDGKAVNDKGCEGCMYQDNTIEHHPCGVCCNAYNNRWTARSDKIKVGDEVIYNGTTKCIVVCPEDDERYASLFDSDGTHYSADHRECKKTGRHFDIASILEAMNHD